MTAAENIKQIRNEKQLTQRQLGELCGIAESTIRRYELGLLNPKRETLQKIADALDVSIYELTDELKDIVMPDIGKQIRKYRENAELHQHELAKYLNVSMQTLSNWETGRREPSVEKLFEICKILNVPLNDMYGLYLNSDTRLTEEEKQHLEKYRFISRYSPDGIDAINYTVNREYKIAKQIRDHETSG